MRGHWHSPNENYRLVLSITAGIIPGKVAASQRSNAICSLAVDITRKSAGNLGLTL